MLDIFPNLKMQNTIIDCQDTRKKELVAMIDSLFSERIDYWIELLFVVPLSLSPVDNNQIQWFLRWLQS